MCSLCRVQVEIEIHDFRYDLVIHFKKAHWIQSDLRSTLKEVLQVFVKFMLDFSYNIDDKEINDVQKLNYLYLSVKPQLYLSVKKSIKIMKVLVYRS